MNIPLLDDETIMSLLGARVRALRLRKDISQKTLAEATGLSLNVIKGLEQGQGKIGSLIPVLRELDALDQLNNFIPKVSISPSQLQKRQIHQRQRASREQKPQQIQEVEVEV